MVKMKHAKDRCEFSVNKHAQDRCVFSLKPCIYKTRSS